MIIAIVMNMSDHTASKKSYILYVRFTYFAWTFKGYPIPCAFNRFEEEGHAERKYNHFRLIDLTQEELYAMGVPAILDDKEE